GDRRSRRVGGWACGRSRAAARAGRVRGGEGPREAAGSRLRRGRRGVRDPSRCRDRGGGAVPRRVPEGRRVGDDLARRHGERRVPARVPAGRGTGRRTRLHARPRRVVRGPAGGDIGHARRSRRGAPGHRGSLARHRARGAARPARRPPWRGTGSGGRTRRGGRVIPSTAPAAPAPATGIRRNRPVTDPRSSLIVPLMKARVPAELQLEFPLPPDEEPIRDPFAGDLYVSYALEIADEAAPSGRRYEHVARRHCAELGVAPGELRRRAVINLRDRRPELSLSWYPDVRAVTVSLGGAGTAARPGGLESGLLLDE